VKLPCEHALWYVLPQIRAELARELVERGLSQKDAAEKLGLTPAAVSQYLHKKRGSSLPSKFKKLIENAADGLLEASGDNKISSIICDCCTKARSKD